METIRHDAAFPATAWSLVARAASSTPQERSAALEALLRKYLPALRVRLVIDKRIDQHKADDLLQEFVTHKILEQDLIARADRGKGRFRTFVLTALDRYVIDRARYEAAAKRSAHHTSPDAMDTVASDEPEPSAAFDLQWARQVIDEAARRMHLHCQTTARLDLWELFRCRVLDPALEGAEPEPYDRLIRRFGFTSPAVACNALVTAKRMFERNLRAVVAEYAADEADIDREIAELRRAVG